ncbi:MAG: transglycosylase SLT domain-containing protein [Bacteroidota bacterium]
MKKTIALILGFFITVLSGFAQQTATDEVYQQRISAIKTQVELIYHPEVKKHIEYYINNPETVRQLLLRGREYFPIIDRSLKARNLPIELRYLPAAASEFSLFQQNSSGGTGIWMMLYNVAKMYKGKINSFVDERRDVRKSSQIAATHLRDLYTIYHQWPLVIAAYGATPVQVNKSIRLSGNSLYYWDVHPFLTETVRDLYPKFVATVYIFNHYKDHGIKTPVNMDLNIVRDSVQVFKWLSLQQISGTIEIPIEQLRELNPVYKKDIIPFSADGYWVFLPKGKADRFGELRDSVYNPSPAVFFEPVAIVRDSSDSTVVRAVPVFDKKRVYYTVKRGENLTQIAGWFDVTKREIVSWNNLKTQKVKAGKKLIIWVPSSKTGYYKRINTMSAARKKRLR